MAIASRAMGFLSAALVWPGDTLIVTCIDPLARSLRELQNIVHELREKRAFT